MALPYYHNQNVPTAENDTPAEEVQSQGSDESRRQRNTKLIFYVGIYFKSSLCLSCKFRNYFFIVVDEVVDYM